ncbi:MAG: hypothetical protein HOO95_03770 [Gallionella sp.]|nr:hypothetical protein [Gallionella sp.]
MKKNLAYSWGLICALINISCFAASYQVAGPTIPYTWVDISITGTNVTPALTDDSVSAAIPIGFTFNYGGLNYTTLAIGSNGWLFFGATSIVFTNTTVSTVPVSNLLLPYWDDLNPAGVAGRVKYQTLGVAPNRQFVVSYLAVPTYPAVGANTFQVILNESGSILYNYQATNDQGLSATIGYQVSTTDFVQYSFNAATALNLRTLTWLRISPSLINLKTVAVVSDPVNNASNPKFIPGAIASYAITINNASQGVVDTGTVIISDPLPINTEMLTGGLSAIAPYVFTDGVPVSGLTCNFVSLASLVDCIDFSNNNGATWSYVPIISSDYDPAVTNIRFKPTGVMSGDTAPVTAPYPNFTVNFKVRLQ